MSHSRLGLGQKNETHHDRAAEESHAASAQTARNRPHSPQKSWRRANPIAFLPPNLQPTPGAVTAYEIKTARNILNIAPACLSSATFVWEI
jgi:hypothetical protein